MKSLTLPDGHFYGETLENREVAGFRLTETAYAARLRLPKHSHERPYFCFILQGVYDEIYEQRGRVCRRSMLVYHPSGEVHSQHFKETAGRLFRIEVEPAWLERVRALTPVLNDPLEFRGGVLPLLAAKLHREFREMDEVSPLAIEGLALEIVAAASRRRRSQARLFSRQPPRWLERAREMIHARAPARLTLSTLAQAASVHPVYLAREFRQHYRCTIGEYVRRLRVEAACRELVNSDTPLAEVAAAAGFYDQSHFSKTFKRMTGLTPTQYRAGFRAR
jgi:AraC family transcriptional regulator